MFAPAGDIVFFCIHLDYHCYHQQPFLLATWSLPALWLGPILMQFLGRSPALLILDHPNVSKAEIPKYTLNPNANSGGLEILDPDHIACWNTDDIRLKSLTEENMKDRKCSVSIAHSWALLLRPFSQCEKVFDEHSAKSRVITTKSDEQRFVLNETWLRDHSIQHKVGELIQRDPIIGNHVFSWEYTCKMSFYVSGCFCLFMYIQLSLKRPLQM